MDLEAVKQRIRDIDNEIAAVILQIGKLEDAIEESHGALKSAKKVQQEFDDFVSRKRKSKDSNMLENAPKSFKNFLDMASSILTGDDYWKAKDRVDELCRIASMKNKSQNEDLDYCKKELQRLKRQREDLMAEYDLLSKNANEGGAAV